MNLDDFFREYELDLRAMTTVDEGKIMQMTEAAGTYAAHRELAERVVHAIQNVISTVSVFISLLPVLILVLNLVWTLSKDSNFYCQS